MNVTNSLGCLTPPTTPPCNPISLLEPSELDQLNKINEISLSTVGSRDVENIRLFTNKHLNVSYPKGFFLQFLVTQGCICLQLVSRSIAGDNEVVGAISGRISLDSTFSSTLNGHIYTLAVDDKYRRQGLGTRLIAEIEKEMVYLASRVDCTLGTIGLEVRATDSSALKFYSLLGFEECGVVLNYYCQGEHCIKMIKTIGAIY